MTRASKILEAMGQPPVDPTLNVTGYLIYDMKGERFITEGVNPDFAKVKAFYDNIPGNESDHIIVFVDGDQYYRTTDEGGMDDRINITSPRL